LTMNNNKKDSTRTVESWSGYANEAAGDYAPSRERENVIEKVKRALARGRRPNSSVLSTTDDFELD